MSLNICDYSPCDRACPRSPAIFWEVIGILVSPAVENIFLAFPTTPRSLAAFFPVTGQWEGYRIYHIATHSWSRELSTTRLDKYPHLVPRALYFGSNWAGYAFGGIFFFRTSSVPINFPPFFSVKNMSLYMVARNGQPKGLC